jgi:arginase/peptidyl-tRNA hydrolase
MTDIKLYILVNTDLNMSSGKIGAQVAHSACRVVEYLTRNPTDIYNMWKLTNAKIVLGCNTQILRELISKYNDKTQEIWCDFTIDSGRTEIEPGSLTTIAFCPMKKDSVPKIIKSLKTLKDNNNLTSIKICNNLTPAFIIAECSIGQKKSGVDKGGKLIYDYLKSLDPVMFDYFTLHTISKEKFESTGYADIEKYVRYEELFNRIPITLGGDHSIGLSTVSASLNVHSNDFLLLWIDAHADINTIESSLTGSTHGMPVASLMGLMKNELSKNILKPENIIYYGIRDLDKFEEDFIRDTKIEIAKTVEEVIKKISNYTKVHISFDVDSLDPTFFPSTGTKVDNGISPKDVSIILQNCVGKTIALDIVEFNPEIEPEKINDCLNVLEEILFI